MHQHPPYRQSEAVVGIGMGVLLSILTCGIYLLFWQHRQIQAVNAWLGREEYDFVTWILLTVLTCGIFALYYDYRMAQGINEVQRREGLPVGNDLALLCVLLTALGLGIASLALRQNAINGFYGESLDF